MSVFLIVAVLVTALTLYGRLLRTMDADRPDDPMEDA